MNNPELSATGTQATPSSEESKGERGRELGLRPAAAAFLPER